MSEQMTLQAASISGSTSAAAGTKGASWMRRLAPVMRLAVVAVGTVIGYAGMQAILGDGHTTPPPAAGTIPSGFRSFVDKPDHFQIATPSNWFEVNPASPDVVAAYHRVAQDNPAFAQFFGTSPSSLTARGVRFLAVDTASHSAEPPAVSVVVASAPGFQDSDLGQLGAELRTEYAGLGLSVDSIRTVHFNHTEALQVSLVAHINLAGSQLTATETQYAVGGDNTVYVISMAGSSPDLARIAATFKTS